MKICDESILFAFAIVTTDRYVVHALSSNHVSDRAVSWQDRLAASVGTPA